MSTLMLIFILSITSSVAYSFTLDSCEDLCDRIDCPPLECPPGYFIQSLKNTTFSSFACQCCPVCVRLAYKEENCTFNSDIDKALNFGNLQISVNQTVNISICGEGLYCLIEDFTICAEDPNCTIYDPIGVCMVDYKDESCLTEREKKEDAVKHDWSWTPECDVDGAYAPKLCKGNRCYCVNKRGKRIFGKQKNDYFEEASKMTCGCSLMEEDLVEKSAVNGEFNHVSCTDNGNFHTLQCIRNLCFCVNSTTGEVDGPILPKSLKERLKCYDENEYQTKFEHACQQERGRDEAVADYYINKEYPSNQITVTKCEASGGYVAKQCNSESCFCANPKGERIGSTSVFPLDEQALIMDCNCQRDRWETGEVSLQSTPCERNGNYKAYRCSDTFCHCIDNDGDQSSATHNIREYIGDLCQMKECELFRCYISDKDQICAPDTPCFGSITVY